MAVACDGIYLDGSSLARSQAIEEALVVEDTLCIVMEYADGKDLDTLIKQRKQQGKPFTEEEVAKIFWQLTSALAHCHHDLHMLHRDLKPANVFMMANGDVKLGDFGLAKIIEATCAACRTQCGCVRMPLDAS